MVPLATPSGHLKDKEHLLVPQSGLPMCPTTGMPLMRLHDRREEDTDAVTKRERARFGPSATMYEPEQCIFGTPALRCALESHYAKVQDINLREGGRDSRGYTQVQFVLRLRMLNEHVMVQRGTTGVSSVTSKPADPLFSNNAVEFFSKANCPPNVFVTGVEIVFSE
jgi:hypothetical protein